ncbi:MAG: SLC13 family permease, partial [Peptococcaceae bacterium]
SDLAGVLASSWGSDTGVLTILLMIFIAFLEATGTTAWVAAFLMTRKVLQGHPWRLIFVIFLVDWLLCSFCKTLPGVLLTWGFVYKICDVLDYKPFDKFSNLMVFGVAVVGAISLSSIPWTNNALIILNAYTASTGEAINYVHYLAYSVPVAFFSIIGFMLLCKFIFRLDVSRLKDLDPDIFSSEELTLTKDRKIALGALIILVIAFLLPSILPAQNIICVLLKKMGLTAKMMLLLSVLALIRIDGKHIFDFAKMATKGVPWNMITMIMGILSFISMFGKPESGISAFLSATLTPIFSDVSVIIFFLLIVAITIFLTNFMINIVVAVIMISATIPIATNFGIDSLQIVYLITICCTIAFMLPPASAASNVLFANTEWVRAKDVYLYSIPTIIMLAAVALIWNLIFFMF